MDNKIILFTTDWCGPCKMLKEKLNTSNDFDKIKETLMMENASTSSLSKVYNVRSVPSLVIDDNGKSEVITGYSSIISKLKILQSKL